MTEPSNSTREAPSPIAPIYRCPTQQCVCDSCGFTAAVPLDSLGWCQRCDDGFGRCLQPVYNHLLTYQEWLDAVAPDIAKLLPLDQALAQVRSPAGETSPQPAIPEPEHPTASREDAAGNGAAGLVEWEMCPDCGDRRMVWSNTLGVAKDCTTCTPPHPKCTECGGDGFDMGLDGPVICRPCKGTGELGDLRRIEQRFASDYYAGPTRAKTDALALLAECKRLRALVDVAATAALEKARNECHAILRRHVDAGRSREVAVARECRQALNKMMGFE